MYAHTQMLLSTFIRKHVVYGSLQYYLLQCILHYHLRTFQLDCGDGYLILCMVRALGNGKLLSVKHTSRTHTCHKHSLPHTHTHTHT